jgi:hypothetical protein
MSLWHAAPRALAPVLIVAACSGPSSPDDGRPLDPLADVTAQCLPGCTEPDPFPTWPGYFLSSAVTPDMCIDGEYNDIDGDRLGVGARRIYRRPLHRNCTTGAVMPSDVSPIG